MRSVKKDTVGSVQVYWTNWRSFWQITMHNLSFVQTSASKTWNVVNFVVLLLIIRSIGGLSASHNITCVRWHLHQTCKVVRFYVLLLILHDKYWNGKMCVQDSRLCFCNCNCLANLAIVQWIYFQRDLLITLCVAWWLAWQEITKVPH